jgi:hypothetical protein
VTVSAAVHRAHDLPSSRRPESLFRRSKGQGPSAGYQGGHNEGEMFMKVEGDQSERRSFGDVDSAVEYINHRPNERLTIYDATKEIIDEIRRKVRNTIKEG